MSSANSKAQTYLKAEEKDGDNDSSSCNSTYGGSGQDGLAFTYDDGTDIEQCYIDEGGVLGMPSGCGSSDRPLIRVEANYKLECDPDYCTSDGQCDTGNECTTSSCVNNLCASPSDVTNFTSCSAGPGFVCFNGDCIDYCTNNGQCDTGDDCTVSSCEDNACTPEMDAVDGTLCSGGPGYTCQDGICTAPPPSCAQTPGTVCGSGDPMPGFGCPTINKVWSCVNDVDVCDFPEQGAPGGVCYSAWSGSGGPANPHSNCGKASGLTCTVGQCYPGSSCQATPIGPARCATVTNSVGTPRCSIPVCWKVEDKAGLCAFDDII